MYRYSKHNKGALFGGIADKTYSGYMVLNENQNHVLQQELFKILAIKEFKKKNMKPIIVLLIGGKGDDVDYLSVHLFSELEKAQEFCRENTDKEDERYWQYCEIIEDGKTYEPGRYKLYKY